MSPVGAVTFSLGNNAGGSHAALIPHGEALNFIEYDRQRRAAMHSIHGFHHDRAFHLTCMVICSHRSGQPRHTELIQSP
jgi:hypothetical protein